MKEGQDRMSRIWSMMDVGKRSLMNSQTALQTVSHNVASKGVEGYSRQRVELQTNVPVGEGKLRIGMGARPGVVTRINNPFIEKQIQKEGGELGQVEARSDVLARVEQVFNEQNNKGLNHFMSDFFNSFRELSNNPESLAARTMVRESGDFLAKDFQRVDRQLDEIQADVDFRLATKVEEVNQLTKEIANLNEKIQSVELGGVTANDERDRRDLLIKKLGELVNIRYAESESGQVTITAGNTAVLVSGFSQRDLTVAATPARDGKREGRFEVFYKSADTSTPVNVTSQLNGGAIGGLLEARDSTINKLRDDVDSMAYTLAREVNEAHREGYTRYGHRNVSFFNPGNGPQGAAGRISLSRAVSEDVNLIASAGAPNAPGDNRIANVLSALQYKQVIDGEATVDEFYSSVVGKVGIEAQRANSAYESQKDIVKQLQNIRESISGVSLDEETTKMIEYQKAFDASARIIRTADEMMDTVLNLKRV